MSEIKWIGNDPTKARLTLDPLDALFNFVGNARCGDIDIINEEECEAANPWRALLNTLWFMKWPMEPEYFSIGGGEILSPETKRRCGSQLRHVLDYSNNAQMYREFATKHGWSHREATFAADEDWYTFAKLIKTVSRIKDYQGVYMGDDRNRLCPPGTHHGVTSNLLV